MARGLSGVARRALKTAAWVADQARRPGRGVVILAYHRVGGASGSEVDLPTAVFTAQMEALAASDAVVSLEAALATLAGGTPPGDDPVVLTFDDGTADFAERALPVLERLELPVTLYAATEFIDAGRTFPGAGRPASWAMLREAVSTGLVALGSHTHRHLLLDRVDPTTAADELDRSVQLIEDEVGVRAVDFAYPKAVPPSAEVEALVRSRFRSAALAGTRANRYGTADPHRLARSPVQVSDGMRWFHQKVAGGMWLEDQVRTLANRRRLAGATT